ncbi:hypothetical protein NDU88_004894 [Pleurodeles waltl]|uniref:Uncharacterized protein n=1 Tax=Pleurodeles waltl TaxID=8319 RepID=A0AAV7UHZ9_PLEWA|nr:hypothetical protein NDU88_004894 [Pleurodeles waltl]
MAQPTSQHTVDHWPCSRAPASVLEHTTSIPEAAVVEPRGRTTDGTAPLPIPVGTHASRPNSTRVTQLYSCAHSIPTSPSPGGRQRGAASTNLRPQCDVTLAPHTERNSTAPVRHGFRVTEMIFNTTHERGSAVLNKVYTLLPHLTVH